MTKSATRETADIASVVGRKNAVINGNFDIWQRATSQTALGYGSDDRWHNALAGSTQVVSRQAFTLGQTDVPNNPKYYSRMVVTSVAGTGNYVAKNQRIEGVETFAGTTATISFWAKADANKNIVIELVQVFGSGGSPSAIVPVAPTTVSLTTSWVKHTVSVAVPSIANKVLGTNGNDYLQLLLWMDAGSDLNARTNSLGQQSGTFEFSQVQLEAGSVATTFEPRSVGEELDLCQRYFQSIDTNPDNASSIAASIATGHSSTTTTAYYFLPLIVTMRTTPTFTISNSYDFQSIDTTIRNLTNLAMYQGTTRGIALVGNAVGFVAGRGSLLRFDAGTYFQFIRMNSEL